MLKDKTTGNGPTAPREGAIQDAPRLVTSVPAGLRPGTVAATQDPDRLGVPAAPSAAPQKSGTLTLIVAAAVLVLAIIVTVTLLERRAAAAKKAAGSRVTTPVSIIATTVRHKDVPIYLDGLGTVQAFNTVTVRVRVDGQLQKVGFTEGQDVHAGDLLAQIDPAPYKAQLDQNIAKKAQDAAQLANARLDLKRETELVGAKIDSQQVYDTQKALVDQLEATVNADQAAIQSAQVQLNYTTVTSPLDGRTGIRLVDQGNIVHATDTNGLVVITQLKPISVVFTLPEQTLDQLRKFGGASSFKVLAVDRDDSTPLDEGTLAVIDNEIDPSTATLKLKATFPNNELHLWPGQFVNARLLLTTRSNGVVVPAVVIQRGPQGDYAFVVESNRELNVDPPPPADGNKTRGANASAEIATVKMQAVKDQIIGADALIEAGLSPGQRVVLEGQYKLQDGSAVKVSMASKGAAKSAPPADSVQ